MTDLTEQWKKGELLEGFYYCKTGNGVEILRTWGDKYNQLLNNLDEVFMKEMSDCKIISEVPSYDEWFKIKNLASLTSLNLMKKKKKIELIIIMDLLWIFLTNVSEIERKTKSIKI